MSADTARTSLDSVSSGGGGGGGGSGSSSSSSSDSSSDLPSAVRAFLVQEGLDATCSSALVKAGVECVKDILCLSEDDLTNKLGLKLVHAKRLIEAAKKANEPPPPPTPPRPPSQPSRAAAKEPPAAVTQTPTGERAANAAARAAAREALGAQERSEFDKELYDYIDDIRKLGLPRKVKGMLDRGADPNGHKVRRT